MKLTEEVPTVGGMDLAGGHSHRVGRGYTDGRRTPHPQLPDGINRFLVTHYLQRHLFTREPSLVQQL